ncbi:MspA family porin [Gordonia sp. NPDC057258]|uniref:MspA family porin n=1 Tax=unclassified Gordonia (in: high G+C Gram-positive bacteria) TaxID=2657482 RepID=UPI00363F099C
MSNRVGFRIIAALVAIGSLAAAAGAADATPTPLSSKYDRLVTDDGWTVTLKATELVVNPMSNIANVATSREGWISSKVDASITGKGRQPIQSAVLEQFLVIGCQIDVSDGATVGLATSFGPSVGVTISGIPAGNLGASASVSPSISTKIRPGRINEISLGKKTLQTDRASIRAKRVRVGVDGCLGPTTVRIIARLSVSSPTADDTINIFSSRTWL